MRWRLLCGPYWGGVVAKGHFLSPDSLAKGEFLKRVFIILMKTQKNRLHFSEISHKKGITFGLKFLEIM